MWSLIHVLAGHPYSGREVQYTRLSCSKTKETLRHGCKGVCRPVWPCLCFFTCNIFPEETAGTHVIKAHRSAPPPLPYFSILDPALCLIHHTAWKFVLHCSLFQDAHQLFCWSSWCCHGIKCWSSWCCHGIRCWSSWCCHGIKCCSSWCCHGIRCWSSWYCHGIKCWSSWCCHGIRCMGGVPNICCSVECGSCK